jgi:flagellar secretion chaperone FliS
MLLTLYERAIIKIRAAEEAKKADHLNGFWQKLIDAQKCILVIHGGLKTEESEVAFNIGRLLHFAMNRLWENQFDDACKVLESIRKGFEAIRGEATRLEKEGLIPPLEFVGELNTSV